MPERSFRLKRDTPLQNVIAAFNSLVHRVDAVEGKAEPQVHSVRVRDVHHVPGRGHIWTVSYDDKIKPGDKVHNSESGATMKVRGIETAGTNCPMGLIVVPVTEPVEPKAKAEKIDAGPTFQTSADGNSVVITLGGETLATIAMPKNGVFDKAAAKIWANAHEVVDALDPNSVKLVVDSDGIWNLSGKPIEPLTQADVHQAVEHAVKETRTGLPDATAPWTLHLGPGCVVENTETGNRFSVEAGNAIALDADVKLRVLDKAEQMIDMTADLLSPVPIHDVRILGRVRDVANGKVIWPVRINRAVEAPCIVTDGDGALAWVVEVDHDDPEGFSTLRVQPLAAPGH